MKRRTRRQARGDHVFHDLVLAIDGDAPAAGQARKVDAVPGAGKADLDAVVDEALALEPLAQPGLDQDIDAALLEHAGADATFDIVAAAILHDDGIDAGPLQQMGQQQPGRSRADDADLRALGPRPRHQEPAAR